jgi:hypothetical protein
VRKLTPVDFAPWTLPLLAVAISVPVIAAFALGGPAAGMAAGALVAAVIIVIAARARFDEEIEVAPAVGAAEGGVLVVATTALEGVAPVDAIRRAQAGSGGEAGDVLVLAPALNRPISHWLSDLRHARLAAQERLAVSLAVLAAAGIDARGQVGDTDPIQAIEDALRSFPAAEVVFVTGAGSGEDVVAEVRRRLDRPVTHEIGDDQGPAARRSRERTTS